MDPTEEPQVSGTSSELDVLDSELHGGQEHLPDREAAVEATPAIAKTAVEKRVFWILLMAAALALLVAVAVNWLWSPVRVTLPQAQRLGGGVAYEPSPLHLEKPAVDLLPDVILAYETIARHGIPGQSNQAAEALYATLNMNLEAQIAVGVYARVEGYASEAEAKMRQEEIMEDYPLKTAEELVGSSTIAKKGYTDDEGAYAVTWTNGPYTVLVKTSFRDNVPAQKRDFLRVQSDIVVKAIEQFQRTGKQGVQAG